MIKYSGKFLSFNRMLIQSELQTRFSVTALRTVDMTHVENYRHRDQNEKIPYTAFFLKALAIALSKHPNANKRIISTPFPHFFGTWVQSFNNPIVCVAKELIEEDFQPLAFVKKFKSADMIPLEDLGKKLRSIRGDINEEQQKFNQFTWIIKHLPLFLTCFIFSTLTTLIPSLWENWRGGAAIISSPCKYGIDQLVAKWHWPIGFSYGLVKKYPFVQNDKVVSKLGSSLTLSFDRRLLSGGQGARFFNDICELLENKDSELFQQFENKIIAVK